MPDSTKAAESVRMIDHLQNWLVDQGLAARLAEYLSWLVLVLAVILLALLANYIAKRFLDQDAGIRAAELIEQTLDHRASQRVGKFK